MKKTSQTTLLILTLLLVLLLGLVSFNFSVLKNNYYQLFPQKNLSTITPPQVKPEPHVNYELPTGPQTYRFSHGKEVKGPRVTTITFSPLKITPQSSQSITAVFPDTETLSTVNFIFDTDQEKNQKVSLKKTGPGNTWATTWTPTDTANKIYNVKLLFVGQSGQYQETMHLY